MLLTSDPHAWLRPYYATVKQSPSFAHLAPSLQFSALCDAVAKDHPSRAAWMRDWSPTAQDAALTWLASAVTQTPPVTELELWTVRKDARELRCVARYLPSGIDLRLMQGKDFRRTELHRSADAANAKAAEWKRALVERGWQ
jgi:hypothetical protein